jgi:hydrogenase nickel incorporation protein HypA/HybF
MHEYPITEQIVKVACAEAAARGHRRVLAIDLVVGDDAGYVGDTIQLYFDLIAAGTLCEDAALHIRHIRPRLACPACGQVFVRQPFSFACPVCGTNGHPTATGKEFYIESLTLESDLSETNEPERLNYVPV